GGERRILLAGSAGDLLFMQRPKVDDDVTLLTDFGKTEGIVVEVLDNPATEEGVLLKVMVRGPLVQGQEEWIVVGEGSEIRATMDRRSVRIKGRGNCGKGL